MTCKRSAASRPHLVARHMQRRGLRGKGRHHRQPVDGLPRELRSALYELHGPDGRDERSAGRERTSARSAGRPDGFRHPLLAKVRAARSNPVVRSTRQLSRAGAVARRASSGRAAHHAPIICRSHCPSHLVLAVRSGTSEGVDDGRVDAPARERDLGASGLPRPGSGHSTTSLRQNCARHPTVRLDWVTPTGRVVDGFVFASDGGRRPWKPNSVTKRFAARTVRVRRRRVGGE
jgi:hypothetical protein